MGIFKNLVTIGVYHIENGKSNFPSWSRLMIDELGPNVQPHLKDIMEWSIVMAHKNTTPSPLKRNCWDYYQCGRTIKGDGKKEHDVCPAYYEKKLNGVHNGKNGGRACWVVTGTQCRERIKRLAIPQFLMCKLCDFKKTVISEEKKNFIVSDNFMKMLLH